MTKPTLSQVVEQAGISKSYASEILTEARPTSRRAAIHVFRKTGWKHKLIADLTEDQISALEAVDPYQPKDKAA